MVSPDAVRERLCGVSFRAEIEGLVWAVVETMVAALAEYHDMIILDATNVTEARRGKWKHDYNVLLAVIDTPADVCIKRAEECGRPDLIPVIERMDEEWERIDPDHTIIYHQVLVRKPSEGECPE